MDDNGVGPAATEPLRVLVVDVSPADANMVVQELHRLGRSIDFERVETTAAMRAALERRPWDAVIADWTMPAFDGRAALSLLKELRLDLPFIIVSATGGEEHAVAAIRAGAHDYLLKNKLDRLMPALERELREHQTRRACQQAERARLEVERRMRRMIESASVGIWFFGAEGKTSFMNQRMAQILGLSAEEAAHASIADFVDGAGGPTLAERLAQREPAVAGSYEHEFRRKDGTVGWGVFESGPLSDETGRFEGVLTVMTDVTEQRKFQEAQREAELRFRRLFDSGIIGVTVADRSGNITEANDTFLEMLGYTRDELRTGALSWVEITPVEWRAMQPAVGEDLRVRGSTRPFEKEYLRKDGTRIPVLVGLAILDGSRVVTVVTDLTERKRVETALVERVRVAALAADVGMALTTCEILRDMLQGCCDAVVRHLGAAFARIWTLNTATNILELQASAGMYTHIDGPHGRVPVGKLEIGLIAKEQRPRLSSDVQNDPLIDDAEWARREGMQSFAGHPLIIAGELVGVMAVFGREPLTEVAIDKLASIAGPIAIAIRGKLIERTNLALEEQLRQSQKMEAVGRLAGGVAHDFNNLLSVILSYSEMVIADLKEGDPLRADIEEIRLAGVRAADLTRQLLMFSRQQVVAPKVLDLNDVLSGMDKMLRRLVGEDVELTAVLGALLGRVRVDPGSIEQVIMNLAINARDAMPRGGKLTMETADVVLDEQYASGHLGAKPGSYVMLAVTDNGTGMDTATRARIFEPFFTTKERGKGTGLGLSTVFGIVQQSGGSIWVYSEPGMGTTFKIYLPRVDAVAENSASLRPPTTLRGSETILLVEDEEQVRSVARGILVRHGYSVIEASNAGEALLLCERHQGTIHLLLTDVVMPQMSGPELAKRLCAVRPEMKVLCMSGYADDAAVRHGVMDAALAYLQKPLTVEALTRKVREVLDSPSGMEAS